MLNKFLRNLSLLMLLNLLIKPVWVLIVDRQIQLTLGNSSYGLYAALFSFSLWFTAILDPGIRNFHNSTLAQNHQILKERMGVLMPLKLLLSLVYLVVIFLAAYFFTNYWKYWPLLAILAINQIILSYLQLYRANASGLALYKLDSLLSVSDRFFMLLLAVPIFFTAWFPAFQTLEVFVIIHTIGFTLSTIISWFATYKYAKGVKWQIKPKYLVSMLKQTYPYALFLFLMIIYVRADFVMINQMLPDGNFQTGVYAMAYRLLEAGSMFVLLLGNLLLPVLSSLHNKIEELVEIIKGSFKLVFPIAVVVSTLCFFYAEPIMLLFYGPSGQEAAPVFSILMLNFISLCMFYIFGTALTAGNKLKALNLFALVGVVLNICLNLWLIPVYGVYGAAFATVITQAIVSATQIGLVLKNYKICIEYQQLIKVVAFVVLVGLSFSLSLKLNFNWLIKVFVLLLINFTFAAILGFFKPKYLKFIFKSNSDEEKHS